MSRRSSRRRSAGFTLIEALVALALLATVLSSIGMVIATSVKGTRTIDQRLALAGTADTLLATLPSRELLKPGTQSGTAAGQRWRIDVAPMAGGDAALRRWTPVSIKLRVQSPNGPALQITTVRLVEQRP